MTSSYPSAAVAIIVVLVLASSISITGATKYDNLIEKGRVELTRAVARAGSVKTREDLQNVVAQYQQAANTFRAAEETKPANGLAWLFRGATFNRMGELIRDFNQKTEGKEKGAPAAFCTALDEINHAQTLMAPEDEPTLLVELAFALLRTGKSLEAKKRADEFLSLGGIGDQTSRAAATQYRCKAEQKIQETEQ